MARILMVASEAAPFAKTGGLADVVGALPQALAARGEEVGVVLPRYRTVPLNGARRLYDNLTVWLGPGSYRTDVYVVTDRGVSFYFVDCPALYDREQLYAVSNTDYPDNHIRFAVLCHAALGIARSVFRPRILHCHDWQAALVPVLMRHFFGGDPTFLGMKTLLTIHNLGYHGRFARPQLAEIGLDNSLFRPDALEYHGDINFLKGGICFADALSTVSRGYAREIQTPEHGFGLDDLLRDRARILTGILNGVDYTEWNPEADRHIAAPYSIRDLSGKRVCKQDLLAAFGLPHAPADLDRPVIGIVSRFALQKGFDLIAESAGDLMNENVALVALGTGEPQFENFFRDLAASHPDRVAVRIAYDNRLAHKIEAGADIFLMPSRYEPCGLNQIYSLRYGTVPVVRATGGLDDTIDSSTGFKFQAYSGEALLRAVRAALSIYGEPERWAALVRRCMEKDFSWEASAAEYSALYRRLAG